MLGDVRGHGLLQGLASGGRVGGAEAVLREVEVQGGGSRGLHHLSFTSFIFILCGDVDPDKVFKRSGQSEELDPVNLKPDP